jgi:hypothetical protein
MARSSSSSPRSSPATLTATCHCGAVRVHLARRPRALTSCNCSICRRYGCLWTYTTTKGVRFDHARGAVVKYVWGDRMVEFNHCATCGCVTHYEMVRKGPDSRVAVNARMLPPETFTGLRVRLLDGAGRWKTLGYSTLKAI